MLNTTSLPPVLAAIFQDMARIPADAQRFALEGLTDTQLQAEARRLAGSVSFYNAAEGDWSRETEARNKANGEFRACRAELQRRGLEFVNDRGWLL